ncbi:MAG: SDR family oxidoreductase [Clostridia bacterium]|nr:SDR family oxidoreductase [Clostridia bacterium]
MDIRFDGKVVVITGAAGGIGRALSSGFAADGARVAVCDIRGAAEAAEEMSSAGGELRGYSLDVTDMKSAGDTMEKIASDFGGIDVLINNAGINVGPDKRQFTDEFDDEWWDRIINVDLNGVYICTKAAVPYMKGREGSNIINISSVVGMVPFRRQCAFNAAKAGVINFSKAMALEFADYGIRVNVIAPGSVCIPVTQTLWKENKALEGLLSHIPQHRQGSTEDISGAARFLASGFASYITGTVLNVDGGWICGYARDF